MMIHSRILGAMLLALFLSSSEAQARTKTTGPEGSEVGKGGYSGDRSGDMGLHLQLGGAGDTIGNNRPLFVGAALGFWADDWAAVEVSGLYNLAVEGIQAQGGARFRWPSYPVAPYFAARAGGIYYESADTLYFVMTPEVGFDYTMDEKWIAGIAGAWDIQVANGAPSLWRMFLNLGRRF